MELADGGPARMFTVRRLGEVVFPGDAVADAVRPLTAGVNTLAAEARQTHAALAALVRVE